ncbi:winged helix-turn-helix transcriptional regulator [Pseudonocardia spinosispora]|uniref:winged helix-turn-helix transcriptional regulator n=1 Tax=Pseudonocardia spinosispora TaxID=103441 RepID=UPI00040E1AB3|nr:helix-turn-helix domain-containing protein [Pseudonocardia spinosispora]
MGATLVTERWNLLIVRELLSGPRGFNDIHRGLPGLSRTLLSQRLRTLRQAGLVATSTAGDGQAPGYRLTAMGAGLRAVLFELGSWSVRWCFSPPTDDQLDPHLLLWRMRTGLVLDNLPDHRITIEITFGDHGDPQPIRGWLVLAGADSSLCTRHPLFDVDVYARATSRVWHELWYGHRGWGEALDQGILRLSGEARLLKQMPHWFHRSAFATQVDGRRTVRGDSQAEA